MVREERQTVWCFKASLWDCCIVPNDAWPSLGVFGAVKPLLEHRNWGFHSTLKYNTSFVTIWVPCQLLLILRKRLKYSTFSGKLWENFTVLLASWWINHTVLNGNLANNFQISEQNYAKTEMVGGFDTYESF